MLLDRIGPPGRCRGDVVMIYWLRGALTSSVTLTRARGPGRDPAVTGSLANEVGRAKTAEGSRACFSSGFPGRVGAEEIRRGVSVVYWFRRRDAARGDRAGWAVQRRRSYEL